jgi:hypothetical protein
MPPNHDGSAPRESDDKHNAEKALERAGAAGIGGQRDQTHNQASNEKDTGDHEIARRREATGP